MAEKIHCPRHHHHHHHHHHQERHYFSQFSCYISRYPRQQVVTEPVCTWIVDRSSRGYKLGALRQHGRPTEESFLRWGKHQW